MKTRTPQANRITSRWTARVTLTVAALLGLSLIYGGTYQHLLHWIARDSLGNHWRSAIIEEAVRNANPQLDWGNRRYWFRYTKPAFHRFSTIFPGQSPNEPTRIRLFDEQLICCGTVTSSYGWLADFAEFDGDCALLLRGYSRFTSSVVKVVSTCRVVRVRDGAGVYCGGYETISGTPLQLSTRWRMATGSNELQVMVYRKGKKRPEPFTLSRWKNGMVVPLWDNSGDLKHPDHDLTIRYYPPPNGVPQPIDPTVPLEEQFPIPDPED